MPLERYVHSISAVIQIYNDFGGTIIIESHNTNLIDFDFECLQGIMNRYTSTSKDDPRFILKKTLHLHLCGNPDLGDSGTAAIAAAIRNVITDDKKKKKLKIGDSGVGIILDTLDLSACEVGDAGAKAIALVLESQTDMCIRHLDLSNNKLSDVGASALAHALMSSAAGSNNQQARPALETLDLSGNKDIKDQAAAAIAEAVGKGLIGCVRMRSCHVMADGAAAFGRALKSMAKSSRATLVDIDIDLSGNPLGVLRGKTDKDGKYSASAIKSKASATTAAYMSKLRKGIKSGLKEYGMDLPGSTAESDDEEEARSGTGDDSLQGDLDPKKAFCGLKAFSNAILDEDGGTDAVYKAKSVPLKCQLGLRRCFLDHSAADALAAVLVHAQDDMGVELTLDVALNPVLEEEMTGALQGEADSQSYLREMSDRYLDALDALQTARERAAEATKAAAARIEAEAELEAQWDLPTGLDTNDAWGDEEEEWDSDADYEQEDEYDY